MGLQHSVLIGYANGDVHFLQVMDKDDATVLATNEAKDIGHLTNAGFRTVVASVWMREETKSAGLLYAAIWNEMEKQVIVHNGSRMAQSHELYTSCHRMSGEHITATDLMDYCRRLSMD